MDKQKLVNFIVKTTNESNQKMIVMKYCNEII